MALLEFIGQVLSLNELAVIAIFVTFVVLLFRGVPVVMALVGVSLIFVLFAQVFLDPYRDAFRDVIAFDRVGIDYRKLPVVAGRLFGSIIKNPVLVALPMFIFMGLMLDQSGVAQRMMQSMQRLFGSLRGGLSLTVLLIGIILAASTGVIGASVTLLGMMALPAMMAQNYSKPIATGTIASAGTLGILIPPSIMLVIMSDQLAISLGDLFMGALFPGLILGVLYIAFIVVYGFVSPGAMPVPEHREAPNWNAVKEVLFSVIPPLFLILLVLGSIFVGLATPTEASGLGALGATLLAFLYGKLNFGVLRDVSRSTINTSGYIMGIFLAANFFAYVLRGYGGDEIVQDMVGSTFENPYIVVA
ncbi:MAG: TRAP transporter large permease subunit, partial [Pseudomonadota bacterium]